MDTDNKPDTTEGMTGGESSSEAALTQNKHWEVIRVIQSILCIAIILCALLLMTSTFLPWRTEVNDDVHSDILSDAGFKRNSDFINSPEAHAFDSNPRWQIYSTQSGWETNFYSGPFQNPFYQKSIYKPMLTMALVTLIILFASLFLCLRSLLASLALVPLWGLSIAFSYANISYWGDRISKWNRGWGPGWGLYFAFYISIAALVFCVIVSILRIAEKWHEREGDKRISRNHATAEQMRVCNVEAKEAPMPEDAGPSLLEEKLEKLRKMETLLGIGIIACTLLIILATFFPWASWNQSDGKGWEMHDSEIGWQIAEPVENIAFGIVILGISIILFTSVNLHYRSIIAYVILVPLWVLLAAIMFANINYYSDYLSGWKWGQSAGWGLCMAMCISIIGMTLCLIDLIFTIVEKILDVKQRGETFGNLLVIWAKSSTRQ